MTKLPSLANAPVPQRCCEPPVLGWLDRRDFRLAQRSLPCFSAWKEHHEFASERDALFLGYGVSGVTAHLQRVSFRAFERWLRLTGAPPNIDGLDEFAAHCRWRALHPEARTVGLFGVPDSPERNAVASAGAQCIRIRPEVFVRWRDEFAESGLFAAPALDVYAAHVVELCLIPDLRARRPEVSSS